MVRPCGSDRHDAWDKWSIHALKHGVAAENEGGGGFTMPRSTFQGLEVGAGSGQCVGTEWTKVGWDRTAWHSKIHGMKKWRKQEMADHSVIGFE